MDETQKISVNEELKNLVKAIYSMLPSRNMVSQLIMLLPLKEESIEEMFPEITKDIEYWEVFRSALGLGKTFNGNIDERTNSIAHAIKVFVNAIFEYLDDEKNRIILSYIVGEPLPNPQREWLEVRLETVLKHPTIGSIAKKILLLLIKSQPISIKELSDMLKIDESKIKQCVYVLQNLKLIETRNETISLPHYITEKHTLYLKKLLGESENEGKEHL